MPLSFTPRIAIIILNWNGWRDTIECLNSITKVSYPNYQVILVDNHSIDGSVEKIRHYFPNIDIIQNDKNLGFAEGNNVGIREALRTKAEYLFILNNDTILDPFIFSHLLKKVKLNAGRVILSPRVYSYSSPKDISFGGAHWIPEKARFLTLHSLNNHFVDSESTIYQTDFAMGCAMFFSRNILTHIGFFDSKFFLNWDEVDWCTRARQAGIPIYHIPAAKVWHKGSSTFKNKTKLGTAQYYLTRNWLLWIEKHLRGKEKIFAYRCHIKEVYRLAKKIFKSEANRKMIFIVLKARLEGMLHYSFRIFGQRPTDRT